MPVNDRYPLADVLAECRRYVELRRRKVFVEYVMLAGVNDSPADAQALAAVLDPRSFKVNLIPYNPTGLLRRLVARDDRAVQGRARARADPRDGAADARSRHRGGVRAAGVGALMERVTGIGGVFFRARDPQALVAWYAEHLGVPVQDDGVRRSSRRAATRTSGRRSPRTRTTGRPRSRRWSTSRSATSTRCSRSSASAGVEVDERIEELDGIGRFGWAVDPEGNRFELWEPALAR